MAGHALKVVPLISWSALGNRPAASLPPGGRPGGPGLYVHSLAVVVYGLLTAGVAAVCAGFAVSVPGLIAVGGGLLAAAGLAAAASLSPPPLRMLLTSGTAPGQRG